jgi:hypothetical protein
VNEKTLLSEIDNATRRLADQAIIDQKREMLDNIYPLLKLIIGGQSKLRRDFDERLGLCEDAVADMITGADDRIHERLATRIHITVDFGVQICECLVKRATEKHPLSPDEVLLMQTFRDSAAVMLQMVDDVFVSADEGDEEDDDGSEQPGDGDGRGGNERSAVQATTEEEEENEEQDGAANAG